MILDNLFENNRAPGSPYDRGGADAWYHRARRPHKWVDGRSVALTDPREIEDYNRGYDDEGITGRHQGKQYDVREDDAAAGSADPYTVLEHLTNAYRDIMTSDAYSPRGKEVIHRIHGMLSDSLKNDDLDEFSRRYNELSAKYPDHIDELMTGAFESAGLDPDTGTIDEFMAVCQPNRPSVAEGKPQAHSIDYAVWSRKSPDEQQMLRQLHPKLKIKNVPPKPRAERVKKGKIDYAAIARKAEAVLGSTFPDGDPMDWMYPYISRHLKDIGIPKEKQYGKYEVYPILDRAIKMHVDKKGYDHWLETTWDQVADDNMMPGTVTRDNNPWRVAEGMVEAGPFSYGAKKHPKGSIADLAARRRQQHERNKPVIEPKDQMVGTAKVIARGVEENLDQFHRNLGKQIRDRAAQDQAAVAMAQARDPSTWLWKPGDQVLSKKTGRTYTITGRALSNRHGAMYRYQRGQEGSDDFERGSFIADRAHQGLTKLNLEGSDQLAEKWSEKYRRSINCNNPRGFSQRAHCAGRKKNESVQEGDVIHTKFATKQAQRGRDQYHKVEGLDIPVFDRAVGRALPPDLARDPVPFHHFFVRPGRSWFDIVGVMPKTAREYVTSVTPSEELANALVDAYNRGGFTDLDLRPVRLRGYNDDPEVTEADQAQRYVLYLNGQPAAHFASHSEAQRQAQAVLQRRPDTKFEIRPVTPGIIEDLRDPRDNPCWKGYHPVGTKKKAGRTVPNCVPKK